jgi:hypothetical protein
VFATTASNTTSATGAQRDNANTAGPPNLSGAHPSGMTISARTDPEVPLPTTLFHGGATSVETGILKPSVCCGNAAVRGCHRGEICSVDINRRAQTQLGTGKVFIRACRGEVAVAGAAAGIEERTASVVARAGVSSTTQSPIAIVIPRAAPSTHALARRIPSSGEKAPERLAQTIRYSLDYVIPGPLSDGASPWCCRISTV